MSERTQQQLGQIVPRLSTNQLHHIAAMLLGLNRAEAAQTVGVKPGAVYQWPREVAQTLDLVRRDPEEAARQVLKLALFKAALVKVAALDSASEATRQKAASEIIEGLLGRSFQRPAGTREEWLAELAAEAANFHRRLDERFLDV